MTLPPTASGSSSPCTAISSRRPPMKATSASSPKALPATWMSSIRPTASRSRSSPTRAAARRSTSIAADGAGPARKVTDLDDLKTSLVWSPDSKTIAFVTSDRKLLTDRGRRQGPQGAGFLELRLDRQPGMVAGRQADRLLQDRRLPFGRHLSDSQRRRRGEEDHVRPGRARPIPVFRPTAPRSTSSAAKGEMAAARGGRSSQLFCVPLEKLTRDPDEADQRRTVRRPNRARRRAEAGWRPGRSRPRHPNIDWAGLKRRTRQVTRTGVGFQLRPRQRRQDADFRRLGRGRRRRRARRVWRPGRRRHAVDLYDPGQRQADDPDRHRHAQAHGRRRRRSASWHARRLPRAASPT